MYDKELVAEIFKNIAWSLEQISKRFQAICSSKVIRKVRELNYHRLSL
jgi:hypothetical protein